MGLASDPAYCRWGPGGAVAASERHDEPGWELYRFVPIKLRVQPNDGNVDGQSIVQLGELVFRNNGRRLDMKGAVASVVGEDSPQGEGPSKAIDDDSQTKWTDFGMRRLSIRFPKRVAVDSYTFFTASDAAERDPIRWRLE